MPDKPQTSSLARKIPLLPLRELIVFPHEVVPLFVGREKSIKALEEVMKNDALIFLATQKNAKANDPVVEDIHEVGTIGVVVQMLRLPDGTVMTETAAMVLQLCDGRPEPGLLPAPGTLPAFGPWMLAQAKGYYKAEGLDVKFVAARGGVA